MPRKDPEARKAYWRERYKTHKERVSAANVEYIKKHPEKKKIYQKTYEDKNRELINAKKRARYKINIEEMHARQKAERIAYPERQITNTRNWRRAHPEKPQTYKATRRARKKNSPRIEPVSLTILFTRDRKTCSICHKSVKRTEASIDHIIPLSQGGAHVYANCALAHRRCNSRKHTSTRFPQQLGLF